jgi:hypothetical protein
MPSTNCFGLHLAVVVDNDDPEGQFRLKLLAPAVSEVALDWALACVPVGAVSIPSIGSQVWVMFHAGDPNCPVWMGTHPQL